MTGERPAAIWLLTDRRYLEQRMPSALAKWLEDAGYPAHVVVADECGAVELGVRRPSTAPWSGFEPGDVVAARSRHPYALALLAAAEALGARTLDSWTAICGVRDKVYCATGLARRGVPVPPTFLASRPGELAALPDDAFPLILKPVLGDNARGLRVVADARELAVVAWDDDLVLAQSYLDSGGVDVKVYVAGEAIWAVRRPSPLSEATDGPLPARVTRTLRELVEACRAEFGLHLFGLDLLELAAGPVVVDVNEFPNYTGVEEAPAEIGRALVELATAGLPRPRERVAVEA
jgi:ribosomal protein S6--L-glutamate ligase